MYTTRVYEGDRGWFFEVWTASRLVVIGWSSSRQGAEAAAAQA